MPSFLPDHCITLSRVISPSICEEIIELGCFQYMCTEQNIMVMDQANEPPSCAVDCHDNEEMGMCMLSGIFGEDEMDQCTFLSCYDNATCLNDCSEEERTSFLAPFEFMCNVPEECGNFFVNVGGDMNSDPCTDCHNQCGNEQSCQDNCNSTFCYCLAWVGQGFHMAGLETV